MSYRDYSIELKTDSLEVFVRKYALLAYDPYAVKVGLLLVLGDSPQVVTVQACHGVDEIFDAAVKELERIGALEIEPRGYKCENQS